MDARLKEAIEKAKRAAAMAADDIEEAHRAANRCFQCSGERYAAMLLRDLLEPARRIVSRLAEMEE